MNYMELGKTVKTWEEVNRTERGTQSDSGHLGAVPAKKCILIIGLALRSF
jgi:hypothetical protein